MGFVSRIAFLVFAFTVVLGGPVLAQSYSVQPVTCSGTDKVSAIGVSGVVTCTVDDSSGGGSLTVEEADTVPSIASVSTIQFDQADGFVVTDETGGQVQVDITGIPDSSLAVTYCQQGGTNCPADDDIPEAADYSNLTGGAGVVNSPTGTVAVDLKTASEDAVGTTQSASGLEFESDQLTLMQGCDDDQVLKWDETQDDWNCEADLQGAGLTGWEVVSSVTSSTSANKAIAVSCTAGNEILGGGAHIDNTNTNLALNYSRPLSTNDGWEARGHETDNVSSSWALTVYAICANTQ